MEPINESRRADRGDSSRRNHSLDGVNLGVLFDDYLALPVSDKEASARQRCLARLAMAEAVEEVRNRTGR
ncbi:MAG: hypothetical protein AB9869_03645 [Verrucomicrobiia bacterium]